MLRLCPQSFWFIRSGIEPKVCISRKCQLIPVLLAQGRAWRSLLGLEAIREVEDQVKEEREQQGIWDGRAKKGSLVGGIKTPEVFPVRPTVRCSNWLVDFRISSLYKMPASCPTYYFQCQVMLSQENDQPSQFIHNQGCLYSLQIHILRV